MKHNLENVLKLVSENFTPKAEECKPKTPKLMMYENFDLRGIQSKVDVIESNKLCTGWTLFLNRSRTLAHIMHVEDASEGTYIRMRIPYSIHGADPKFIKKVILEKMVKRYVM